MIRRVAMVCAVALACSWAVRVEAGPEPVKAQQLVGTWQGTLANGMGGQIRVVLHLQKGEGEGALTATMDSPDQGATAIPVAKAAVQDGKLTLDVAAVKGSYEGTIDAAKAEITGTWRQSGQEIPLVLKKDAEKK